MALLTCLGPLQSAEAELFLPNLELKAEPKITASALRTSPKCVLTLSWKGPQFLLENAYFQQESLSYDHTNEDECHHSTSWTKQHESNIFGHANPQI
jgi:hypothetical protein